MRVSHTLRVVEYGKTCAKALEHCLSVFRYCFQVFPIESSRRKGSKLRNVGRASRSRVYQADQVGHRKAQSGHCPLRECSTRAAPCPDTGFYHRLNPAHAKPPSAAGAGLTAESQAKNDKLQAGDDGQRHAVKQRCSSRHGRRRRTAAVVGGLAAARDAL